MTTSDGSVRASLHDRKTTRPWSEPKSSSLQPESAATATSDPVEWPNHRRPWQHDRSGCSPGQYAFQRIESRVVTGGNRDEEYGTDYKDKSMEGLKQYRKSIRTPTRLAGNRNSKTQARTEKPEVLSYTTNEISRGLIRKVQPLSLPALRNTSHKRRRFLSGQPGYTGLTLLQGGLALILLSSTAAPPTPEIDLSGKLSNLHPALCFRVGRRLFLRRSSKIARPVNIFHPSSSPWFPSVEPSSMEFLGGIRLY